MPEERGWTVLLSKQAERSLRRLPEGVLQRVDRVLQTLEETPIPAGSRKLSGYPDVYRVRVGDWRIVYVVDWKNRTILVAKIAPRGDAYRNL